MKQIDYIRKNSLAALLVLMVGISGTVIASPIGPGFDLFATDPNNSSVDLSSAGLGVIAMEGVVLDIGLPPPSRHDTDTIVLRKQGIDPLDPPGGTGTIDIEIVALQLKSVDPVDLGGGNFGDLYVTLNKEIEDIPAAGGNNDGVCDAGETCKPAAANMPLDNLLPSVGQMTIRHDTGPGPADDFGGTFDSFFDIFVDLTFVVPGGDPFNPGDILDSQAFHDPDLTGSGVWSHTPRLDDTHNPMYPSGGLYAGLDPDPSTVDPVEGPQKVLTEETSALIRHGVLPAQAPEPTTLALMGLGLAGMGYRRHRSKKAT